MEKVNNFTGDNYDHNIYHIC